MPMKCIYTGITLAYAEDPSRSVLGDLFYSRAAGAFELRGIPAEGGFTKNTIFPADAFILTHGPIEWSDRWATIKELKLEWSARARAKLLIWELINPEHFLLREESSHV